MVVLGLCGGLASVGWGLRTWRRGGPLRLKTGRAWSTAGQAAVFWLLIGAGLLVAGFLPIGAWSGAVGSDVGFFVGFVPLALACLAVTAFRPRRVAGPGAMGVHAGRTP